MTMWLKEPLVHFLVLGAAVFALYGLIGPAEATDDEIVVTRGQQEHLIKAFTRTWQRPPTQAEFTGIVDEWIREEIAYREGLRMGLDIDDTIIRRRLRQKLETVAEDIVSMAEPTDEILRQHLDENQADYAREPVYSLRQIYFSVDERGAAAARDAEQARIVLETDSALTNPETMGDRISLPHRLVSKRESAIGATVGPEFAEALRDLEPGSWQGPIRSGYGLHVVLIEEFRPGRPLTFEEAERDVRRDVAIERRAMAIDTLHEQLRSDYVITVEPIAMESPNS